MTNRHQEIADNLVEAFKRSLGDEACRQIGEAGFDRLKETVSETLSHELERTVERLSDLVRQLRSEIGKPELGL